jgi:hypothetical protein
MNDILKVFFGEENDKRHPMRFLSLAQFAKYILDQTDVINYDSDWSMKETHLVEDTMFAGRTDYGVLGNYCSSANDIIDVDVKAMYPTAMMGNFPNSARSTMTQDDFDEQQEIIDTCIDLREKQFEKGLSNDDDISYLGQIPTYFCYANIYRPTEDKLISWGPLAHRMSELTHKRVTKLRQAVYLQFFNDNDVNRPLNSVQIKMLIFGGWRVQIIIPNNFGFIWKQKDEPIFTHLMNKFAEIKSDAKAAKTVKLLMNSIAGKLGQKSVDQISTTRRKYTLIPSKRKNEIGSGREGRYKARNKTFDRKVEFHDDTRNFNFNTVSTHYLASLIWSWSHFMFWCTCYKLNYYWINKKISVYNRPPILLYCDTDSIFLSRKNSMLFDDMNSISNFFNSGGEMGSWDDAKHNYDIHWSCKFYDRIIVLGKKSYWIGQNHNSAHFKGVRGESLMLFAEQNGYQQLVEACKNNIDNILNKDNINDRCTDIAFDAPALTRQKIDTKKLNCYNTNGLEWKSFQNRFIKRVTNKKTTVKFSQKYDPNLCKINETFIQVFSPEKIPEVDNWSLFEPAEEELHESGLNNF